MLVVISDLHFQEVLSDLQGFNGEPIAHFERNLPARAFQKCIARLAEQAENDGAQRLDFVLAGDVFELHRTSLWFQGDGFAKVNPFVSPKDVGEALETKLLNILEKINADSNVRDTLEIFRNLSNGKYMKGAKLVDFPVAKGVQLHYIPGNHDRLANSTPGVRSKVRELLGLQGGDAPFPHTVPCDDPSVLVRHGHEYDHLNFSVDLSGKAIPLILPDNAYDDPTFGDYVTIAIGSRIPYLFRKRFHKELVEAAEKKDATSIPSLIYHRLLEFDDLRPQSAALDFLINLPQGKLTDRQIRKYLDPIAAEILNDIRDNDYFNKWIKKLDKTGPDRFDLAEIATSIPFWDIFSPVLTFRLLGNLLKWVAPKSNPPELSAAREEVIQKRKSRFVVAGHTHTPQFSLIDGEDEAEYYYINTGTWRNRILSNPSQSAFGRLKSLTYVVIYGSEEDQNGLGGMIKRESVDYWDGLTKKWST
jgi:UDP-2,3-diacylglucosamine pyrophosphatase LpxH